MSVKLTPNEKKKRKKNKFFVCKKKSHQAGRLRRGRGTTGSVVLAPDQEVHQRLGLGLQVFHEVQRETLQVCPATASAEAAALSTLEHTEESLKATRVSAVSVKAKATGGTEPASPPKDVDDGDSKLHYGDDSTGDDVKWCGIARTNNKFTITVIS